MPRTIPSTVTLAALLIAPVMAGEPPAKAPIVPPPVTVEENPLSFFGGKLVFDFQERLRFEFRENNFDFNDGANALTDDSWLLQRARLGLKFKPAEWFTLYAQGQDAREIGSDRPNVFGQLGAEGDDAFDLRQGWIQLGGDKGFSARLGRQVLSYGDERLVGPLDWNNGTRTFDAVRLRYAAENWSLDAFTSSVVRLRDSRFNESDWPDSDDTRDRFFSGLYFSTTALGPQTTDAYAFQLHEDGGTDFWTLGTRVKADPKKLGGWEYEGELAAQFGEVKDRDLAAFAGHAGVGYNWLDSPWKPRLAVEYNYATGDDNAADGDVGTFQNLFPTNHKFYGFMDVFSWQNLHNPAVTLSAQPTKTLSLRLDYHLFWLADTGDAWYRANGTTQVRPITKNADTFVGSELDFTATWKATKWLSFQAGYSHFFAGNYLSASGANDDADFAYVMTTLEF